MDVFKDVRNFFLSSPGEKRVIGKSLFGRDLFAIRLGFGAPVGIAQYAIHGREWITSYLAFEHFRRGGVFGSVWFVPLANPDGALLSQKGLSSAPKASRAELLALNGGGKDFSLWKANGRGVDLNVNFAARWGGGKSNVFAPGGENYVGAKPFSEPETQALKDLIDEIKPTFTYALHNSGFGGVYWYVTEDVPELYPKLREAVERQGIPLHLGEPESPAIPVLAPAVLLAEGIEVEYDYFERFGAKNISKIISSGTCSDSYSKQHYGTFTFLTEMPYFFDPRIADPSITDTTRGAAVIEKINWTMESNKRIREVLSVSSKFMGEKNPYLMAVNDAIEDTGLGSNRRMAEEDSEYKRLATQAEYFDNVWVSRFYRLLSYGMLIRAHEYELEREHTAEAEVALLAGKTMAEVMHKQLSDELEQKLNYSVIPIRKLINIQLECGLKAAQIIHDR